MLNTNTEILQSFLPKVAAMSARDQEIMLLCVTAYAAGKAAAKNDADKAEL